MTNVLNRLSQDSKKVKLAIPLAWDESNNVWAVNIGGEF